MKRLFAAVASALLLFSLPARAEIADDQYVGIYNEIQDADALEEKQPLQALAKYTEAQTALQRFQRVNPNWNTKIVDFRLEYLASKITILTAQTQPPKPAVNTNAQAAVPAAPPVAPSVPVAPAVPKPAPLPAVNPLQSQVTQLQNEIRLMQGEKFTLESKLREALAARPASTDPKELAKAQEQVRSLQKENDLLQVTLSQQRAKADSLSNNTALEELKKELAATKQQLADQSARADKLTQENESLQTRVKELVANNEAVATLRTENEVLKKLTQPKPGPAPEPSIVTTNNPEIERQLAEARAQIAALQSDKEIWRLEKIALQSRVKELAQPQNAPATTPVWAEESTRVKQLERERNDLQKKLDAALKELYGRKGKAAAARVDELNAQLDVLRARLGVYEAQPVPLSKEELALLSRPEAAPRDPRAGKKSVKELPPGTTELVADAQRDFAAKRLDSAEQKYIEVLRRDDRNVNTLANLAAIELEKGNLNDADKNIKAALAIAPDDVYCLSILGNLKYREEKYDDALDALSHAAKLEPQNAEIQNFLGLTLSQKGLRTPAENAFRRAIVLNPNYGSAQNNLAVFYLTQKPPSVALAKFHYEKALAAGFPHNEELEKALEQKGEAEK